MARKPDKPAREKFAAALSRYFTGTKAPAIPPESLWSYAAFARKCPGVDERTVSTWCKGTFLPLPAKITPILDTIFGRGKTSGARTNLENLYWAASREATDILKRPKLDKVGGIWLARGRVLTKDRPARATDSRAAINPAQQRLQKQIHDLAAEIASKTKRPLYNSDLLKDLSTATSAVRALLDCAPAEIPEQLQILYELSLELGRILETDLAVREDNSDAPLDAGIRGKLTTLVQVKAAWLYGFPSVVDLDRKAANARGRGTEMLAPSAPFVQCLLDRGVIDARDASELLGSLRTADSAARRGEKSGVQGQKLIALARGDVTNLLLTAARDVIIARRDPAPKDGIDQERTRLLTLALLDAEPSVTAMAAHMGADVRQALIALLEECHHPPPPVRAPVTNANVSISAAMPPGDPDGPPSWADQSGLDTFGRWASFSLPTPDGGTVLQRLRWIPPGRFWMGSPDDEDGRYADERPRHEVTIADGFWLFDTPCPQALWQAVMGNNPSQFMDPRRPVETVSFDDIQQFLANVNARVAGLNLSLPSEARWEYACRAGTETGRYAPDLDAIAWYHGNSADGFNQTELSRRAGRATKPRERIEQGTRRVAEKAANPWGLYDMLGNVWEWCEDTWHGNYEGAPTDGSARLEPGARAGGAAVRVLRGGSWGAGARYVRAACRFRLAPSVRYVDFGDGGFRCVRVHGA